MKISENDVLQIIDILQQLLVKGDSLIYGKQAAVEKMIEALSTGQIEIDEGQTEEEAELLSSYFDKLEARAD